RTSGHVREVRFQGEGARHFRVAFERFMAVQRTARRDHKCQSGWRSLCGGRLQESQRHGTSRVKAETPEGHEKYRTKDKERPRRATHARSAIKCDLGVLQLPGKDGLSVVRYWLHRIVAQEPTNSDALAVADRSLY